MLKVNDIFKFSILTKNNYMQDLATVVVLLASIDNSSMVTVIRKKNYFDYHDGVFNSKTHKTMCYARV